MAKILIIEDEKALLSMISAKLIMDGYDVITAEDGEEGLEKVKDLFPDLVLLDIIMPKRGGFEVLEAMHGDPELRKIPVIIISNSGQPVEIDKAKGLGAKDYLVKAEFDPQEVVDKVRAALGEDSYEEKYAQKLTSQGTNSKIAQDVSARDTAPSSKNENGPRVLVVEDDQFLRDLIVKKLEEEGLSTVQAIDGEEGLRLLREKSPVIVLLDLILPGIDGFDVLKQAKADPSIAKIPIIILSNLGQKDDIERGLNLGATDYLIKAHFTPGEIVQKVKEIVSK